MGRVISQIHFEDLLMRLRAWFNFWFMRENLLAGFYVISGPKGLSMDRHDNDASKANYSSFLHWNGVNSWNNNTHIGNVV